MFQSEKVKANVVWVIVIDLRAQESTQKGEG